LRIEHWSDRFRPESHFQLHPREQGSVKVSQVKQITEE